jgi:elongation factor G
MAEDHIQQVPLERFRNIGIIAHIDAGKTTCTERILYYTGITHKIGEVHEGEATMDWMEQERERGITITSAATTCFWTPSFEKDTPYRVNIIDTPGHVDFTIEVQRSLRVLDGAVVILDGKMGVEPQTETVWRQADDQKVPRMFFINKINLLGGDFKMSVASINQRLTPDAIPVFLPVGEGDANRGVIDLIENVAYTFKEGGKTELEMGPIPEEFEAEAKIYREQLIEKAVEMDDAIMERYLEGGEISIEELRNLIRTGVLTLRLFPILVGDGRTSVITKLLDYVTAFLPSPLDIESAIGNNPDTDEEVQRHADPKEPLAALAFKIASDPFVGKLTFIRVYSGTLKNGSFIYNSSKGEEERIGRIFRLHANHREEIPEATAGEIVAVVGLKKTFTGDTICEKANKIVLMGIKATEPVIHMAIEPQTKADQEKLGLALSRLSEEDPTFRVSSDDETGQTIIGGMGELHLDVLVDRMRREFNVVANVGKPQVAYKETIRKEVEQETKYARQTGGRGQYGHVYLRVGPRTDGEQGFKFINSIVGGVIPKEYIPAVEAGVKEALEKGVIAGYPVIDTQVELYDGSYHEVDSSEIAFKIAGSQALQEAVRKADPAILEPIMSVEVTTPEESFGDIMGDLNARRGRISTTEDKGALGIKLIKADVPLASMFGYATQLRSISQGRASYVMEFANYAEVPNHVQAELVGAKQKS